MQGQPLQNIYNQVKSQALSFAEKLTPVLKQSKFKETGNITPEEFIVAGDFLNQVCKNWKWHSGSPGLKKSFLPDDKQYLMTRGVPCHKRCDELKYDGALEKLIMTDGGDAWVDTHHGESDSVRPGGSLEDAIEAVEINDDKQASEVEDSESEEALDIDDCEDDLVLVKDASTKVIQAQEEACIEKTRTYDLYITYDSFYQTPRMWLSGYTEDKAPLTNDETYQDISQEHANKTVTFEAQPHLESMQMMSIHPCKHADVIKVIMNAMESGESGESLQVHMYMVVFLKFIQAAIPTIEYDFTRQVSLWFFR